MNYAILFALSLLLLVGGCENRQSSPLAAARDLVEAAQYGDVERVYGLLSERMRKRLTHFAKVATAQSGGQKTFSAQEMLAGGALGGARGLIFEEVKREDNQATVRVKDAAGRVEELAFVQSNGRWYLDMELPKAIKGASGSGQ